MVLLNYQTKLYYLGEIPKLFIITIIWQSMPNRFIFILKKTVTVLEK